MAALEGAEAVGWDKCCECFAGSLAVVMRYLGEDITDDYAMGITGAAFKTLWGMPWFMANCAILVLGEEPIERAFAALGYGYTYVPRSEDHEATAQAWREAIVRSIDAGRPLMARGIVGPPEACVVTGYEQDGNVLHGWSYFQEDQTKPFRAEGWFDQCFGLILVGDRQSDPTQRAVLSGTLEWALKLARTPEVLAPTDEGPLRVVLGLAAYDEFAAGLERDADFPAGDLEVLTSRLCPVANDGIFQICCKRFAAARFLTGVAGWGLPGTDALLEAAAAYQQEAEVWQRAGGMVPWTGSPEQERLRIADPMLRRTLAGVVREAKALEAEAVQHLEVAQQALTPGGA